VFSAQAVQARELPAAIVHPARLTKVKKSSKGALHRGAAPSIDLVQA